MYSCQCRALNIVQLLLATLLLLHLQAFLVGIVVPDSEVMPGWAKKRGFDGSYAELCRNKVCLSVCAHIKHHLTFRTEEAVNIITPRKRSCISVIDDVLFMY